MLSSRGAVLIPFVAMYVSHAVLYYPCLGFTGAVFLHSLCLISSVLHKDVILLINKYSSELNVTL